MLTRHCPRCNKTKPVDNFSVNKSESSGYQKWCKLCCNAYHRHWYAKNHEHHKAKVAARNKRLLKQLRTQLREYLKTHPCVDCGESDIVVLEFDHRNPTEKSYGIAKLIRSRINWKTILKEIEKCAVRCANCHRRKTAKERNSHRLIK